MKKRTIAMFLSVALCLSVALTGCGADKSQQSDPADDGKKSLTIARGTILVISVIAIFLAKDPESSVFSSVAVAWAGFGGAFGAVMLCALFWKRSNMQGALAGMIAGGVTVFLWKYLVRPLGGVWNIYELLPAFLVSLAAVVIVSLLTGKPEEEIEKEFEAAK